MKKDKLIYNGKIRDGAFGNLTNKNYEVYKDNKSGIVFLQPFPKINYQNNEYRLLVNKSDCILDYYKQHDSFQFRILSKISDYIIRNSTIMDVGCGGGSFLDYVKGISKQTIAIEPYNGYHSTLKSKGHIVYGSINDCLEEYKESIDIIISNHVIEHVLDPFNFIKTLKLLLKKNGYLIITTPNLNDILLKLDFNKFAPFFFRKVHNYYFNEKSLRYIAKKTDLKIIEFFYYQDFGLSNILYWLRDGKPRGNKLINGINTQINKVWMDYLETTRQSNNIGLICTK